MTEIDWLDPAIDPKTVAEAAVTGATPEYDGPFADPLPEPDDR